MGIKRKKCINEKGVPSDINQEASDGGSGKNEANAPNYMEVGEDRMLEVKRLVFHFSEGDTVTVRTSEPEEIIQMIANQNDGWLQYDDIVINVKNVSYIRILADQ
ncbi:hypothetical protein BRE01_65880 [Brevibacillus reuszeri]|uniref:Uncharacterized protein n=3 Tax=Brevibacillus reuszeri TaxID=54915 RepID=A0ABQ0TYQ1_9BACL|nr:hypothetical protein BRE01_65880 [Brevibacillus reuszeri]